MSTAILCLVLHGVFDLVLAGVETVLGLILVYSIQTILCLIVLLSSWHSISSIDKSAASKTSYRSAIISFFLINIVNTAFFVYPAVGLSGVISGKPQKVMKWINWVALNQPAV